MLIKANLEAIQLENKSFSYQLFDVNNNNLNNKLKSWHYHPEIELVYIYNSLYGAPDYNKLISSNWSVTKLAGVPHTGFTTETWLEVLTVPNTAVSIEIDETASGFFGSTNIYWYQVDGGLATSPFANDSEAVSPSQILIINKNVK